MAPSLGRGSRAGAPPPPACARSSRRYSAAPWRGGRVTLLLQALLLLSASTRCGGQNNGTAPASPPPPPAYADPDQDPAVIATHNQQLNNLYACPLGCVDPTKFAAADAPQVRATEFNPTFFHELVRTSS